MEFREYIRIFKKRSWIVILITLIFLAVAWYYNFKILKPIYEADSKVYIGKEADNNTQTQLNDILMGTQLVKDYKEFVKSRMVTGLAAKKLNRSDIGADSIAEMVNVDLKNDTHILVITAEAKDAETAKDVANVTADVFKNKVGEFMQRENVSIIDNAVTPLFPSKPNKYFNILMSTVIGIVLGIGVVFLLEYLDTSIETPQDIEQHLGLQVLGVIPSFNDSLRKKYYGYY